MLLDFGLARPAAEPGLTMTGAFVGTPEYCSPEQIRGEKDLRPATDLYACGITLWRMLAGKAPFTGNSEVEVLNAHLTAPLPPPRRELRGASPRLRALATQLLEKDPARRPADARAALRWLDLGEGMSARAAIAWIGLRSLLRRRAVRLATAGSALLLAGALVLAWLAVPVGIGARSGRLEFRRVDDARGMDVEGRAAASDRSIGRDDGAGRRASGERPGDRPAIA